MELKTALETHQPSGAKQQSYERFGVPKSRDDWIYSICGWFLCWQKKYAEAEKVFRKGHELNPTNPQPLRDIGWCFGRQKRYAEAEELFRKALELDPKDIYAISGLGWCLWDDKKYTEAEEEFLKALELDPIHIEAIRGLGWSLIYLRKYTEAEKVFLKGLEFSPDLHYPLGRINTFRKDYETAQSYFERYLKVATEKRRKRIAKIRLGEIALLRKNYQAAEQLLREALSLDSTSTGADQAYRYLGYLYSEQKLFDKAHGFAQKSLSMDSSFVNYNLLAWILVAGELDIKKGIQLAQLALETEIDYNSPPINEYTNFTLPEHSLGLAYLKKG